MLTSQAKTWNQYVNCLLFQNNVAKGLIEKLCHKCNQIKKKHIDHL